jgi:hypothetical protein
MAGQEGTAEEASTRRIPRVAVVVALATLILPGSIVAVRLSEGRQGLLEALALASVFSVPGVLVVLSLRDRASLLLTAAVLSAVVSVLLVTLMPLLALPAIAYVVAYTKQRPARPVAPIGLVVSVPVVLDLSGALAIYLFTENVCTTTGSATNCGETTTSAASIAAISLAIVATVLGWLLAAPAGAEHHHQG